MKLLQSLLDLREEDDIEDEDAASDAVYAREKQVSVVILRVFRKCGIQVAEHESSRHSGVRDDGDSWGHDVLYSEDDREAHVTVEEATMSGITKLAGSGLVDGDAEIVPTSKGQIRFVFKVDKNVASGKAKMN